MSTILVRAADSALALDEVRRRLGDEALILSTRAADGQVEVLAMRDATVRPRGTGFAAALAAVNPPAPAPAAPRAPVAALQGREPVLDPDPAAAVGGWPGLSPGFLAALAAELDGGPQGFLARLGARLLPEGDPPRPARIVVAGPRGAGKSLLAARIAAQALLDGQAPRLVQPRLTAVLAEDRLRGWARMMRLPLDRPALADLLADGAADPESPLIVDLSDLPAAGPDTLSRLLRAGDAVVVALPTGLHPGIVAREVARWRNVPPGVQAGVCLTRADIWAPAPEELSAIAAAGLRLQGVTTGPGLTGALVRPDAAHLAAWARGWIADAAPALSLSA